MASIQERNHKYKVVYYYKNDAGERKQKWETYDTKAEARKRKKEIEYKQELGTFVAPKCTYLSDLLDEYVFIYGTKAWVMSTYQGKVGLIRNYIKPMIGKVKLSDLNTHFIEKYYQTLLETPAVVNPMTKKPKSEYVTTGTIREIHKLLRNCFEQAIKWELMEKNPCQRATVPKHTPKKREIWEADTMMHAMDVCVDERVVLACNIIFAGTLRPGEVTALSWDAMDISMEAIDEFRKILFLLKITSLYNSDDFHSDSHRCSLRLLPSVLHDQTAKYLPVLLLTSKMEHKKDWLPELSEANLNIHCSNPSLSDFR